QPAGADADEGILADRLAVENGSVADDHALGNVLRCVGVGVHDAAVLQVDPGPEGDPGQVAAEHAAVPDIDSRRQDHIAGDDGILGYVKVVDGFHGEYSIAKFG